MFTIPLATLLRYNVPQTTGIYKKLVTHSNQALLTGTATGSSSVLAVAVLTKYVQKLLKFI